MCVIYPSAASPFHSPINVLSSSSSLPSSVTSPLITDINLNSPNKGLGVDHSENLSDMPVEGAVGNSANPLPPGLTEEEAEELRTELTKVQYSFSKTPRCLYVTTVYSSCMPLVVVVAVDKHI